MAMFVACILLKMSEGSVHAMNIFINPGHALGGEPDPGAVNRELGIRECDIAMTIGSLVANYLELAGDEARLLQSDNLMGEAWGPCVVEEANQWPADFFVSIHCNAFDGNARGTETLYFPGSTSGRELANCIQAELYGTLFLLDPDWSDRGLKERSDLAVLKYTDMPAALVECAFIDNELDAYFLMHYGDEIARAIARGVTDYEAILYQNP